MQKILVGIVLSMVLLLTACVNNKVNVVKKKTMREVATIDISKMPIQTYEEYIKLKKFVLEKYIKEANIMLPKN